MKKFIIALSVFILIISFIIVNFIILKTNINKLELIVSELVQDSNNDYEKAEQLIDKLNDYWLKSSPYIKTAIRHDEWEDIYVSISKLKTYLKTKSYNLYLLELDELKADIEHLFESETFTIDNIF